MTRAPLLFAALVLSACVPTDFDDLRRQATTIALAPPDDYPNRGFGEVVSAYSGTVRGVFGSRVAASAGTGTPFSTFPLLVGEELRLDTPLLDGCDEEAPCGAGAGVSLVGVPRWSDREMCLAAASPDTGEIRLRCEDDVTRIEIANGPSGQRFGESAAGLPEHVFARAVFGAPGAFGGRGSVYRLPDRAPPVEIDLSEGFGAGGELGSAVAALAVDADTVLLAAAAPSGSAKRVIVAQSDVDGGGSVVTRVHACVDATTTGWGMALALGDLNGDGRAEVAIGSGQEPGRLEAVRVYDGATLPPAGTCTGTWPVAIELSCPDLEGVDCAAGSFGAALSIGDVDGDGTGDLIVGTPMAEVDGVGGAGAVFVFQGAASLTDLDRTVVALTASSPSSGAGLGTSVAVIPGAVANASSGARRVEPVAGAPGADRVYVFLCTGLDGDSPSTTDGERCQP